MTDYTNYVIAAGLFGYLVWESWGIWKFRKIMTNNIQKDGKPDYDKIYQNLENFSKNSCLPPITLCITESALNVYYKIKQIY